MNKIFYKNTKDAKENDILDDFIKLNIEPGKAIDLGCGAGRDTVYLIKHGWNVIGIDKENVEQFVLNRLNDNEKSKFKFIQGIFVEQKLEKNDLVVANFSIPFCKNKELFNKLWINIFKSIDKGGYFVGNLFGIKDSWNINNSNKIFFSKDEVLNLFNEFQIIKFEEIEYDGKTGDGNIKHWHYFNIIAKK